jgi:predicted GNAT family N-acyltransferase
VTPVEITFRLIDPARQLRDALAVRFPVFVDEQQVPAEIEQDEHDLESIHVVAYHAGQPVATGRCYLTEATVAKIGRMAVLRDYRLLGLGSAVLQMLENEARLLGAESAVLHAQLQAAEFYATHGYQPEGETFDEAGIEHVRMRKALL